MEVDTPGKYEKEEIEMEEREDGKEESYLPESHWFSQMSSQKELTWKPGERKYRYDFFNQINPKKVFDGRYKDNINLRLAIARFFVDGVAIGGEEIDVGSLDFLEDRNPAYLKDIRIKRGKVFTLEFTYKGDVIGIFDPRIDNPKNRFTKVQGKVADDFAKDVVAYFGFELVSKSKPQIKSIMTDEKPKENISPPKYSRPPTPPKPSREKISPPTRPPTPPKPGMFVRIWTSASSAFSYAADTMNQKAAESLENTTDKSFKETLKTNLDTSSEELRKRLASTIRVEEDLRERLERMEKQIKQQSKEIENKKDEIENLKQQIATTNENNEDLNEELEQKNYELRQIETAFDNLKAERDGILKGAKDRIEEKDSEIQELQDKLELTGSQILERDQEIETLKNKLEKSKKYVKRYPQEKEKLENTIVELKNNLKESETENKKLKDSYNVTKSELEEKNKSFDTKLSKEIESLQSLLESEKGKVKELKKSKKELEKRNKSLVDDFDKLDNNYKANKARLEVEESAKSTAIQELEDLNNKYQEILKDKDLSDEKLLEIEQEKESIEKELQDERDNYSELVKSKENLEKRFREVKQKLRDQQSQANRYSRSIQQELDKSTIEKEEYEKLEQERDALILKNEDLSQSLDAYKLGLEGEKKRFKLEFDRQAQNLKNSNARLQDIQRKLEAKEIDRKKFEELFQKNENRYKIEKKKFDKTVQSQAHNIKELLFKSEIQKVRIEKLEEAEKNYVERIKAKNAEVQEWIDKVKEKEQEREILVNKLSLQDYHIEQFNEAKKEIKKIEEKLENKTKEYNQAVRDNSSSLSKRHALEQEVADLQKEKDDQKEAMKNLQKNMIDPLELEESKNHVKGLSVELDKMEKTLYDKENEISELKRVIDEISEHNRNQILELENQMYTERERYAKKLEKREKEFGNQLKNYIKPGDQKAYVIHLDKLEAIEVKKYSDEEYEKVMKELRTIRDKYRRDAENPNRPVSKRRMDDRFRKNIDYRIDAINHENGRAIETSQGKDIILEDKKGILGSLYRLRRWIWKTGVKYLGVIGTIITIVSGTFYLFCLATGRTLVQGGKDVGKLINAAAGGLPEDIANAMMEGGKLVIHYAKKTLVIATLVIISFFLLYKAFISSSQTEFLVSSLLLGGVIGLGYWYTASE